MQIQWVIDCSIEKYIAEGRNFQVDRTKITACCSSSRRHRHGFYSRHCPEYGELFILRFLCVNCKLTTSLLPTFLTPLKWHSTDIIYMTMMMLIIMNYKVLDISKKHAIAPSTFYRWCSQYCENSARFQCEDYKQRLGKSFPFTGIELFEALEEFFQKEILDSADTSENLFRFLQKKLACPFSHNDQFLPSLGIFRTVLDRGG